MKKGFTLLELVVIIAIIGILSAVILASISEACKKVEGKCSDRFNTSEKVQIIKS